MKTSQFTDIILDFDGTCTQIPVIYEKYLEDYRKKFNELVGPLEVDEWKRVQGAVHRNSPRAGWTLTGTPCAPAAADPYILADESAKLLLRERGQGKINLPDLNGPAYAANPAPWRDEAKEVFEKLIAKGIRIAFISNSSSKMIEGRLQELWNGKPVPDKIIIQSDASKFRIAELCWDPDRMLPEELQNRFNSIPAVAANLSNGEPGRPIYIRRGYYFEAIAKVFNKDLSNLGRTLFCGDIWEMDLAMPHALGANVHLIERAEPFNTYSFEFEAISSYGEHAKTSKDLSGLLNWF